MRCVCVSLCLGRFALALSWNHTLRVFVLTRRRSDGPLERILSGSDPLSVGSASTSVRKTARVVQDGRSGVGPTFLAFPLSLPHSWCADQSPGLCLLRIRDVWHSWKAAKGSLWINSRVTGEFSHCFSFSRHGQKHFHLSSSFIPGLRWHLKRVCYKLRDSFVFLGDPECAKINKIFLTFFFLQMFDKSTAWMEITLC